MMDLSVLKGKDPAGYLAQKGLPPNSPSDSKAERIRT